MTAANFDSWSIGADTPDEQLPGISMSGLGWRTAALAVAVALSVSVSRAAHNIEVQSGDSFRFDGQRIHIANIDAPQEDVARCKWERMLGQQARLKLAELLAAGEPRVVPTGQRDHFDRMLAFVSVNGKDIGEAMIATKLAAPRGHPPQLCASWYGPTRNVDQTPQPIAEQARPGEGNTEKPPKRRILHH
jgi:endonuclease YncB( thermonuclease family)